MVKHSYVLFSALLLLINVFSVSAANVGISPANINFVNVLRGGYAERYVTISISSDELVNVKVSSLGDIGSWLNFSSASMNVSKNNPGVLKISILPPEDVPNGNYTGFVRVQTSVSGGGVEGHATGIVRAAVDLAVTVSVTDVEFRECSASNFQVSSVEKGDDVVFNVNVENRGNTRIRPQVRIDLWDTEQIRIIKSVDFADTSVTPTVSQPIIIRATSDDLDIGQYWAEFAVIDCYASEILTFDVLEPGALRAEGVLTGINANPWSHVDDTLPIEVGFKNIGEKSTLAQFKGKVSLGDKIIRILESEPSQTSPGESTNFTFFFTPKEAGKYIVSGRVFYSGKRTFESGAVLNVRNKGFTFRRALPIIINVMIIVLLAYLISRIKKERREYSSILNRMRGFK